MSPLLQADTVAQGLILRGAPAPWVIWLVIVPALLLFAWFVYRAGGELRRGPRLLLTALRAAVLLFVAFLLLDPAFETLLVERKPTLTMVLVDASASMDHKDDWSGSTDGGAALVARAGLPPGTAPESLSRFEWVRRILAGGPDAVLPALAAEKRLRLFTFGERVEMVPDLASVEPRERETAIGRALERLLDEPESKGNTLGGIVLVSDGRNTAGVDPLEVAAAAARRKVPVHTVVAGDPAALRDVEIVAVVAPEVALVEDRVAVEVRLRHRGFPGQRIELRLLEGPNLLARQQESLLATEDEQEFVLFHTPVRPGNQQWVVEVRPLPGEHSTDNNRRTIDIRVKSAKIRVLYVESYPRWEYRNLMNFLVRGEESFLAQCVLLGADRGFPQERTDGLESLLRVPATEEELFAYDVILFGDVDPEEVGDGDEGRARGFFQLVKRFVQNGGGFAMLAGDRFAPRAYKDTAIGDILPIIIDPTEEGPGTDGARGYHLRLTEVGRTHPILQIADDPARNATVVEGGADPLALKDMYWFAPVKKARPGALVLATHERARNSLGLYPLIVAGHYEEGPVLFFAFDETWRWYWGQGPYAHHRFWGNVVRYLARVRLLAGDKRFRLFASRSELQVGDSIRLTAYVKDRAMSPADRPEQEIIFQAPGRPERRETLRRVDPGKFERTFVINEPGDYQAWIPPEDSITDERISPVSFRASISDRERREPIVDAATMRRIADITGGRSVPLSEAPALLRELGQGTVEIPRQRRFHHLRDREHPWLAFLPLLFVALLGGEWLLRKRWRLL
jgi:uncharacterized membrane protein